MFLQRKNGRASNAGWNLFPISKGLNGKWLNPDNFFWTKKHNILGKFVPQTLRLTMQGSILGIYGAIPTAAVSNQGRNCECGE